MLSGLYSVDVMILQFINLSIHNTFLNTLAEIITSFGLVITSIIIIVLLYIFGGKKGKHVAKIILISIIITYILTYAIKELVMRPRPYTEITNLIVLSQATDASFPSGHTATATAYSYILSKEYKHKIIMIIPILVALSRLYIGVHYPSDVIGGFIVGLLSSYVTRYLFRNTKYFKRRTN